MSGGMFTRKGRNIAVTICSCLMLGGCVVSAKGGYAAFHGQMIWGPVQILVGLLISILCILAAFLIANLTE